VRFGLPDDWWDRYADLVAALDASSVDAAARAEMHPDQLTWVVVGDRQAIEAELRAFDLGPVQLMDADGNFLD
jgi:hypothetical protein